MLPIVAIPLAAILGLFAGGFANAGIMRTKETLSFTANRKCSVCAHPVHGHDTLPIIGYLGLRGRCRNCKAVIPWQYLVTEVAMAALFALFAWRAFSLFGAPVQVEAEEAMLLFARDAGVAFFLVLIFMFDWRASVIPDRLSIPAMFIALLANILLGIPATEVLLGGLLIGTFFAMQFFLTRGQWVGGGDIRMGLLMGFLLGPWIGIAALLLSYILGAVVGLFLIATGRRQLSSHVPFGTFMAVAILVCMLAGGPIVSIYIDALT